MVSVPRRPLTSRAGVVAGAVAVLVAVPVGWASAEPLVPGGRLTTTVDLPDAWAGQADTLGVSVAELRQQENDCSPPEVRAGDTTCGADEGDLAGLVLATVSAGRYVDGGCAPTTAAQPLDLVGSTGTRLAVTGPECLVVALEFPDGTTTTWPSPTAWGSRWRSWPAARAAASPAVGRPDPAPPSTAAPRRAVRARWA